MELLYTDTLDEAREKLWNETAETDLQTCTETLEHALGRICAEDIFSAENIPPFDRSTVDGYAVSAVETYGAAEASPVFLQVCGQIRIEERAAVSPGPGEAVRVQTGSMIPRGADAAVMAEYTESYAPGQIVCYRPVSPGENVIREGEDIRRGERIICRGRRIGTGETGMLAGLGIRNVRVYRKPSVAVISTGDELAGPGEALSGGKIRDINTDALSAAAVQWGMEIRQRIRTGDDEEQLRRAVCGASETCDIVLISGGSSKGNRDYTKKILEEVTGNVFTHGLALKPGKPTILAYDRKRRAMAAGLPGHPLAAVLVFRLLIVWWYRKKTGMPGPLSVPAVMGSNVSSNQGRETCLLVRLIRRETDYEAVPVYAKSGSISALAGADAYVLIPREREGLKKGERVWCERL